MSTADQQIADILAKYGEPIAGNIWRVQGQAVIYHKALERIAAQAGIVFGPPTILRAERDEAVILVTGSMGERTEWSIGEALAVTAAIAMAIAANSAASRRSPPCSSSSPAFSARSW